MLSKTHRELFLCLVSIDLRLLTYLVATVDHGSANQAAAALHLSQPALSRQLRQLETTLDLELFRREGRRLVLTRAGEQFVADARDLLRHAERTRNSAAALAAGRLDSFRLAAPTTTFTDVLAPFLATLDADAPVPIVRQLDPGGADSALRAGADLAIVTEPPGRRLDSLALAVLPIWAYVRPDDPWQDRDHVTVRELVGRPLVLMTDDFRPRRVLDHAVEESGLSYDEVLECTNTQIAQALAAAGRGVAVVSDDPRFGLVPLRIGGTRDPLRIRLFAAWERDHYAADTLAGMARRLADFCAERYGPDVRP